MWNEEETLAEARRRYPIGTRFKCVNGNSDSSHEEYIDTYFFKTMHRHNRYDIYFHNYWIYLDGKWATILSSPSSSDVVIIVSRKSKLRTILTVDQP